MLQLQFPQSTPQNAKTKKQKQTNKQTKKALKQYNETRKYSSSHQQEQTKSPLSMRGTACKSLNSSIASRTSRRPKNQKRWNNPRSSYTSSGFIQPSNLRSLTSRIVHVYRTGLLTAILNLVSNSWFWTQRQANASAEQLTMTVSRMSVATVTASLAAEISLCSVIVNNHRLGRGKWRYNRSIKPAPVHTE